MLTQEQKGQLKVFKPADWQRFGLRFDGEIEEKIYFPPQFDDGSFGGEKLILWLPPKTSILEWLKICSNSNSHSKLFQRLAENLQLAKRTMNNRYTEAAEKEESDWHLVLLTKPLGGRYEDWLEKISPYQMAPAVLAVSAILILKELTGELPNAIYRCQEKVSSLISLFSPSHLVVFCYKGQVKLVPYPDNPPSSAPPAGLALCISNIN